MKEKRRKIKNAQINALIKKFTDKCTLNKSVRK